MYVREQRVLLRHYLERGLSKAEVAREVGVSRRSVYHWIARRCAVDHAFVGKLRREVVTVTTDPSSGNENGVAKKGGGKREKSQKTDRGRSGPRDFGSP